MNRKFRLFAGILAFVLILLCFPGCHKDRPKEESTAPDFEDTQPEQKLNFTLTEGQIDEFYKTLEKSQELFLGEKAEESVMQDRLEQIETGYFEIVTQEQIAYVLFCIDEDDKTTTENYLFASSASADCYTAYNKMCKLIDTSDSPNRDFFFLGWTEDELTEMRSYTLELEQLVKKSDQLLVEYRQLDEDHFKTASAECYLKVIENNNKIAKACGYSDYYAYASDKIYEREYGKQEIASLREQVKTLRPVVEQAENNFNSGYSRMSMMSQKKFNNLIRADYNSFETSYLTPYLKSLDYDTRISMKSLFEEGNSFFTDSPHSNSSAFTAYLYSEERPICYFGPGYQDLFTVVHEMGHYYCYRENGELSIPMDLAEAQSQSNEWLFLFYLEGLLRPDLADTLKNYKIYTSVSSDIIAPVIIDDFEQRCYENPPKSAGDLDTLMSSVLEDYFGVIWVTEHVGDMYTYWRQVAVEFPGYYVSYAISMIAAMQIYWIADNRSYEQAKQCFAILTTDLNLENGYIAIYEQAGIVNPTDPRAMLRIKDLLRKREMKTNVSE